MGLQYSAFLRFTTFFMLIAATLLAMHPYQISADYMKARKLGGKPQPSPPPPPHPSTGQSPNPPPTSTRSATTSGKT
ncbi:hypothetical protein CIPAW_15G136300 [Carya illinoinensis]|uniref:Uncharacterized protein n=1 Tax=Carya illinoinensis TaxID=32201 RepID=A0A8T1NCL7_CARIL|nr:hypothetical protein CIPAW_15G136300 [Carya illinoinensis]KAG6627542.1 hypothetical protein CIPAW_15G136300 [Carya illinoinensis]KAG6627543.1 hypothetical protein CIPAW_15G136300 [Carya illinoinensis]